jgi:glutamate--cysteine ligase catalytic subunit
LNYFDFLLARSKGDLPSAATFVRDFVKNHPSYKADSIVPADV